MISDIDIDMLNDNEIQDQVEAYKKVFKNPAKPSNNENLGIIKSIQLIPYIKHQPKAEELKKMYGIDDHDFDSQS